MAGVSEIETAAEVTNHFKEKGKNGRTNNYNGSPELPSYSGCRSGGQSNHWG